MTRRKLTGLTLIILLFSFAYFINITLLDEYKHFQTYIDQKSIIIILLFILLIGAVMFYFIYDQKLSKSQKELSRFRKTVEDSDNIIIITNEKMKIKYVNNTFINTTGFTKEEVLGKDPKILSSGKQSKEFYKELKDTIYAGKKWNGKFINKNKNGTLTHERATITPVYDENNKIVEFVAIKLDITKEIVAQKQLLKKEKLLLEQSKMAALGEMLQNIAHQWRQPLSIISTASTGLLVKKELQIKTTVEEDIKTLNTIADATQNLSETISAFSDFFNPNEAKINFKLQEVYRKTLNIVQQKFIALGIEVIEDLEDISITNLDNELVQVMLNLLHNARDALLTTQNKRKLIFVTIHKQNKNVMISVKDNAGGIEKSIIDKIFEPYFTTKHKAQGTGIGLYMCQEIITKHMGGKIIVSNQKFSYKDKEYTGAEFKIIFPIS